ncbi:hypothetical protein P3X46_028045 [Hevea brasiliensis]|uniref:Uncharacterized protein n=1 Tax=Hevea brasiliensis TaxID=3981 RepID=A0ABQ9KP07_HEVBR|nr:uncharacterized protein LOC110655307 [Hevea brasiliensis]KAJ9145692.1 hypothetical protein P3X46_028045 [Hevea brasiliensis]
MSNPYEKVKGGRLTFKGGSVATTSKAIDKKKKKKKNKIKDETNISSAAEVETENTETGGDVGAAGEVYTIDAAKRLQYEELFPVEAKKFGYNEKSNFKSMEDALDDRVKKKADRYCK